MHKRRKRDLYIEQHKVGEDELGPNTGVSIIFTSAALVFALVGYAVPSATIALETMLICALAATFLTIDLIRVIKYYLKHF